MSSTMNLAYFYAASESMHYGEPLILFHSYGAPHLLAAVSRVLIPLHLSIRPNSDGKTYRWRLPQELYLVGK